jgi:hydrogenase maturation protease
MAWSSSPVAAAPHDLLDDGFAPEPCELLVIGCGSILRGDDAVGPVLIRHLFGRGVPDGVRLVDGGTAGMDVAFGMRGAARVVIVDASATGAAPGTIYRVPAEELGELPPIDGLHTHNFRWDHALSFSAWLLGPLKPTDITVFLVEAGQFEPGSELSEPVAAAMESVMDLIEGEFYPAPTTVEITAAGDLPNWLRADFPETPVSHSCATTTWC